MMIPNVSVIIPTYKRPATLLRTIASLQNQTWSNFDIIVVDNAADPRSRGRIVRFNATARTPVRYIAEPRAGATYARHTGARASTADVLVFADDDVVCVPSLTAAYGVAFTEHPEMSAAGGPMYLRWEASPPAWLVQFIGLDRLFPILSFFDPYDQFHLDPRGVFFSGNMAIRRDVLFDVGGFNPDLLGDSFVGDGEVGLYRKLWQRKLLTGYVPDALVYHHVPAERMTIEFFRRRMANEGTADIYTYTLYHGGAPTRVRLLRHAAGITARNTRSWMKARLCRGRTDKRSVQLQIDVARTQSQLKNVLRLIVDPDRRALVARRDWLNNTSGPRGGTYDVADLRHHPDVQASRDVATDARQSADPDVRRLRDHRRRQCG